MNVDINKSTEMATGTVWRPRAPAGADLGSSAGLALSGQLIGRTPLSACLPALAVPSLLGSRRYLAGRAASSTCAGWQTGVRCRRKVDSTRYGLTMLTVLDLFAGAGGLSLGLEDAGMEVVAAAEWDQDALDTYAKHHPTVRLFRGDIAGVDFGEFRGSVEVVAGGPPCQPWSDGGKGLGHEDPRDGFPQFIRAVRAIQPRAFLIENVAGLTRGARRSYFLRLLRELSDLGYEVRDRVIVAADYGVPQRRKRLFIVGTRSGGFTWPDATHGVGAVRPWRVAGDVLSAARVLGEPNKSIVTYAKRPDLRPSPYDGLLFNGGGRPVNLADLAPTMLASMGGNKTPWIDTQGIVPGYHAHLMAGGEPRTGIVPGARRITVAETAALQTFSGGMEFAGPRSSQYRQVGNAVPPMLAAAVGRALSNYLDRQRPIEPSLPR
ncbi:MAG: DNA cytosine methyltransferase [Trebonia sp.]